MVRFILVSSVILSLTLSPCSSTFALENGATQRVTIKNVELNKDGRVTARLIATDGQPLAGKSVEVRTSNDKRRTITGQDGRFTIVSSVIGTCTVTVDSEAYVCRLWSHGTAPPKSLKSIGIVHGRKTAIRAQGDEPGFGYIGRLSRRQLLGLGLVAGAIVAVVIAVENDDDGS